jgi:nitrogen fixation protein FixH
MIDGGVSLMLGLIGAGVLIEILLFLLLTWLFRLNGKAAAVAVALTAMLAYVPWAILTWPGADVFAIHLAIFLTVAYALGVVGGRVGRGWHWAPVAIIGFFSVVVVTNVVFLGVAERGMTGLFARLLPEPRVGDVVDSQFPGTVSHDYQEKEALYNRYLEQVEQQEIRGWSVRKGWLEPPVMGQQATFIVAVADRDGEPVRGAAVEGRFLRTSNSRNDLTFAMDEVEEGEYRTTLELPLQGRWDLVLEIRRDNDRHEVRASTTVASQAQTDAR